MFVLFAIALTFFTVSRIQLRTSTNVGNTVRAELLSEAATALAINMLKKDSVEHPDVTSTDHAWTTYFNGLWMAEKPWGLYYPPNGQPPVPNVFYQGRDDTKTVEDKNNRGNLIPHLYVPRFEYPKRDGHNGFISNPATDYEPGANRFVFDPAYKALTYAQRVDMYCDVDNDGDGKKDSIWIPLAQDFLFEQVGLDFNLDRPYVAIEPPQNTDEYNKWFEGNKARPVVLFYPGSYEPRNGVDAWFLTAPIQYPDGTFARLYNLSIRGLPSSIDTDPDPTNPDARFIDTIDNDYDGIINYHIEYYARFDGADPTDEELKLPLGKRILTKIRFEQKKSEGCIEIDPTYLVPNGNPIYRICTTGEPMCELAGRAAILIRDEASKVNMNAAGAHYLDAISLIEAGLQPGDMIQNFGFDIDEPANFMQFWKPAFSSGASTNEYLTWLLPRVGPGRSLKIWNLLAGAPNGSMAVGDDLRDLMNPLFFYDVTLPGYGFVDDNANALLLAMNGIDDNGNGLIDEGTNPGTNLTPDQIDAAWAYAQRAKWFPETDPPYTPPADVYVELNQSAAGIAARVYEIFIHFGILEGVDEPGEFQYNYPVRNKVAEAQRNASIGDYGDRPLPTREYLKRAVLNEEYGGAPAGTANGAFNRMRPFVTIDSGARNNRTTRDEEGNIETLGPKLNYNLASAAQMAKTFIEDWKLDEVGLYQSEYEDGSARNAYEQLGFRYLPEDVNRYLAGDMRPDEQEVFLLNAFLAGMRMEGVNQSGVSFELGGLPRPLAMPADPRLQAMQLAVNIADSADGDYARTELSTAELQQLEYDPWWYVYEFKRLIAAGFTSEEAEKRAQKPINYTVAGAEAIRINEIMVRPVRRVEAETYGDEGVLSPTTEARYNPNIPLSSSFNVTRQKVADEWSVARTDYVVSVLNDELLWNLEPDLTVPNSGVIGNGAAIVADKGNLQLQLIDSTEDPPVSVAFEVPNILEFRFGPSQQLPPGRYYLTVNTVDPATGQPTITKGEEAKIRYLIKYVRPDGSTADSLSIRPKPDFSDSLDNISVDTSGISIIDDILADEAAKALQPSFVSRLTWFRYDAVLGYEDQRNKDSLPSGWVFLSGDSDVDDTGFPDDTSGPDRRRGYVRGAQAHTVTIPHYEAGTEQAFLHVAIYCEDTIASDNFAINFFDFSQEPDHEWVELENVSNQPVNIAGWQVVVGGADSEGIIRSFDKAVLRVPTDRAYWIDPLPPYNKVLLAVSGPDEFEPPDSLSFDQDPFHWNGIGQIGTPNPDPALDLGDVTVPLIPAREPWDGITPLPADWDGRGLRTAVSVFDAPDAGTRIIPVLVDGLNYNLVVTTALDTISEWVLRGGVFPNYPEHDAIDNDYDGYLLATDGVDYSADGLFIPPLSAGVDEGRWIFTDPNKTMAAPGTFSFFATPVVFTNSNGTLAFNIPDDLSSFQPYLWGLDFPIEWKEFTERRLFPGDNVIVSLYEGPHEQKRLVDRITYTERDVVNRAIDDDLPVTFTDPETGEVSLIRPPLHFNPALAVVENPYLNFWPDNTMGLDFYRSLERKYHPLYNGDRFGTIDRWQATDGNYDDWSHEFVALDSPKWYGSPLDRNDAAFSLDAYGLLQQLALVDIRNKSFDSLGDLLSLEYCTLNKEYRPYGFTEPPVLSVNALAGFQPGEETAGNIQSLMEAGVTDAIYLSPGAGTFRNDPSAATSDELACDFDSEIYTLPQAWRPFYLYEISLGSDIEPAPAGLPLDGYYWLFNSPDRPVGLEDPDVLRTRWPVEKRAILLGSGNFPDTARKVAALWAEWDASSGLQDGTYDLYIDTGLGLFNVANGALTDTGKFIRARAEQNAGDKPLVNVMLYTDTNGNGVIEYQAGATESLGTLNSLTPEDNGLIWCGPVGVNNSRLAVRVENRTSASKAVLNTFAGVILTPRARTQGRINVNTVETRLYKDRLGGNDITRRLNILAGIPGVFEDYPEWFAGAQWYTFGVRADVSLVPGYEFSVILRCVGRNYYEVRVQGETATLYSVVDGAAEPVAVIPLTFDNSTGLIELYVIVENDGLLQPTSTTITCTVNQQTAVLEGLNYPIHFAGTVGLISRMPQIGFSNLSFSPVPGVTFSRGWSGIGWAIDREIDPGTDLYRYDGGSTSTLFTGYPANDQLDNDYYITPPQVIPTPANNTPRPPFIRAEWLAKSRALSEHWDGRYFSSISELIEQSPPAPEDPAVPDTMPFYSPLVFNRDPNDPWENLPLFPYLRGAALQESAWRLSRSANLLTTRSDIFEILVTVQAGTGEDLDGDGVINYRSDDEFTRTSERKTRTVYERP